MRRSESPKAILGVILLGMGVFAPNMRADLTDSNVNLYSGIAMLAFGIFLLVMAWRATRSES